MRTPRPPEATRTTSSEPAGPARRPGGPTGRHKQESGRRREQDSAGRAGRQDGLEQNRLRQLQTRRSAEFCRALREGLGGSQGRWLGPAGEGACGTEPFVALTAAALTHSDGVWRQSCCGGPAAGLRACCWKCARRLVAAPRLGRQFQYAQRTITTPPAC